MSDILDEICAVKRQHVLRLKQQLPLDAIVDLADEVDKPRGFHKALTAKDKNRQTALITEIKKASPSKGLIRADFNPVQHAIDYEQAGASCLSILTDEPYFQGKNEYLIAARKAVLLPVLRKDFIVDEWQIYESRAIGADCILLIMACLTDDEASHFEAVANKLGMDVLVEVHDEVELQRALKLKSRLLGINNRNLKTMKVDLETSSRLSKHVPSGYTLVAESGIKEHADILRMQSENIYCFLVGESLMLSDDIKAATTKLLEG